MKANDIGVCPDGSPNTRHDCHYRAEKRSLLDAEPVFLLGKEAGSVPEPSCEMGRQGESVESSRRIVDESRVSAAHT